MGSLGARPGMCLATGAGDLLNALSPYLKIAAVAGHGHYGSCRSERLGTGGERQGLGLPEALQHPRSGRITAAGRRTAGLHSGEEALEGLVEHVGVLCQ